MKNAFLKFISLAVVSVISASVCAASEVPPMNLQLQSNFENQFQCVWKGKSPLKFWVGAIDDVRKEKAVGKLIIKNEETPLVSARPVPQVLKEAIQIGLQKCDYTTVGKREDADIWVKGTLEDFSGSSKKGFLKGKVQGRAEFTLNLQQPETGESVSVSFILEESLGKGGVTKNPKKLAKVLNSLLTRLALDIFQSSRVAEWLGTK